MNLKNKFVMYVINLEGLLELHYRIGLAELKRQTKMDSLEVELVEEELKVSFCFMVFVCFILLAFQLFILHLFQSLVVWDDHVLSYFNL